MIKNKKEKRQEIDGKEFFDLNQKIIDREKQRRLLMVDNIRDIAKVFDKKLYNVEFENFAGFLGQVEAYYTRTEVYRHMNINKRLLEEFNFDPQKIYIISITRLETIAKYAKDKTQAEDLMDKAKVLTSRDWREEINEIRGKPMMKDCEHKMEPYMICSICGKKTKNG